MIHNNTEVLISLGDAQYIVRVNPAIPAGEIHIGKFAALDALVEATGGVATAAPAAEPKTGSRKQKGFKVLRIRAEEVRMAKGWLHNNGHTLNELERKIMAASFPAGSLTAVGSAAVATALSMDPAGVRRVRNAVLARAGLLNR